MIVAARDIKPFQIILQVDYKGIFIPPPLLTLKGRGYFTNEKDGGGGA